MKWMSLSPRLTEMATWPRNAADLIDQVGRFGPGGFGGDQCLQGRRVKRDESGPPPPPSACPGLVAVPRHPPEPVAHHLGVGPVSPARRAVEPRGREAFLRDLGRVSPGNPPRRDQADQGASVGLDQAGQVHNTPFGRFPEGSVRDRGRSLREAERSCRAGITQRGGTGEVGRGSESPRPVGSRRSPDHRSN